jgi:cullin-4
MVCTANQGERLFETLKIELEQCVSRLAGELTRTSPGAMPWTMLLVQICGWFERQIVGVTSTDLFEYTHLELTK